MKGALHEAIRQTGEKIWKIRDKKSYYVYSNNECYCIYAGIYRSKRVNDI